MGVFHNAIGGVMRMARVSRILSNSGIYHIIIRGVDRQDIFLDDIDRKKFLKELKNGMDEYKYEVYAYCLMNNHIHLLIKDNEGKISKMIQSISIKYVSYFNKKYERAGHLFQNRFVSKCIETEGSLLRVQKYIHQNPQIAGIAKTDKYVWSSYKEYVTKPVICNTSVILSVWGDKDLNGFAEYTLDVSRYNLKEYSEIEDIHKINDDEAVRIIKYEMRDRRFV